MVESGASRDKVKEVDETITRYMSDFNDEMAKIKKPKQRLNNRYYKDAIICPKRRTQ
ncbi:MAG: hypothetical protein ACI8PW_001639 [Methylophilaceae bacterium]